MATRLEKEVTREVLLALGNRKPKPVLVTLKPSGVIEFREKGKRRSYTLDLSGVFERAVMAWSD